MKILFINTVYGKGSTGQIVKTLGEAVLKRGGEYVAAYGRGERLEDSHCFMFSSRIGVMMHAGLSRITDKAGFYSYNDTKKLIEYIKNYNPDIIHLHNLHGYYVNIKLLFEYLREEYFGKIIWTLHDCWSYTGHCAYYSFAKCNKWERLCNNCIQKNSYPQSILFDNSKKNYQEKKALFTQLRNKLTVVTVSKWLEGEVKCSFFKDCSIRTIYNGVDINKFKPQMSLSRSKYGIGNKYMFLCVADGWDLRKGYEKVIELSKAINKKAVIVIVGINKKQRKTLPDNVIGIEHIENQKELIDLYCAADVLFNPSKEDTFGLVSVEAMACGTPVIVLDSTANPEVAGGESCGKILDRDCRFKGDISSLYINKKEKENACMVRVKEYFSTEKMVDSYIKLYGL